MQPQQYKHTVMEDPMEKHTVTINLHIDDLDIAVELERQKGDDEATRWRVARALDEDGLNIRLSKAQRAQAIKLAGLGADETGR